MSSNPVEPLPQAKLYTPKPKQTRVITRHLNGESNRKIAREEQIDRATVNRILNQEELIDMMAKLQTHHKAPINSHVQYSFLVECRKFSGFFSGSGKTHADDILAKHFLRRKARFKFPAWKKWADHMNTHLFHLSYQRVKNTRAWTGYTANQEFLEEFTTAWRQFLEKLEEPFKSEFEAHIVERSSQPEYRELDLR